MIYVEADEIVPNLWQGSFPEPGPMVKLSGFDLLILCAHDLQEPAESYEGVEVFHAPNYDDHRNKPLTRERLQLATSAARRAVEVIQDGGKVLVTCYAGLNRSGLVTGITLHLLHGWPGAKCVAQIQKKRSPFQDMLPLHNPEFVAVLKRLGQPIPDGWKKGPGGLLVPT